MRATRNKLLQQLLLKGNRRNGRLWLSLAAVGIGVLLLLLSVMVWWNFKELLEGRHDNDSLGSTFLTISKEVTNENMGRPDATLFTQADIEAMQQAPQVQDVGVLESNRFPVYAVMNAAVGFSTEMFLESVPERFLDKKPGGWQWNEGDNTVPLIVSREFLNLYNYGFALSQGLPQLSESSIQSIAFDLKVGAGLTPETYKAQVVGFSSRISSVLVPESFIEYGNDKFANGIATAPSRLIVKAKDPSDEAFVTYLEHRGYTTNSEQLRWNKLRSAVEGVSLATGALALLLAGMGALVFILFIELAIARAHASLQLLLQIGYSPRRLGRFMAAQFIPPVLVTVIAALLAAVAVQWAAHLRLKELKLAIATLPGWPVWLVFAVSVVVLLLLIVSSIKRAIRSSSLVSFVKFHSSC